MGVCGSGTASGVGFNVKGVGAVMALNEKSVLLKTREAPTNRLL